MGVSLGVSASESLEDDLETTLARNQAYLPNKKTTFHFVGIRPPPSLKQVQKNRKNTMFDIIKPTTITSHFQLIDSVGQFKKFIRKEFQLPKHRDILILYSNIILYDWKKSLLHYGVTDQSCFLLALHDDTEKHDKLKVDKNDKKAVKQVDKTLKTMKIETKKSLDIVTQEQDANVFKMDGCGHSMNKESLYQYSLSQFENKKNKVTCPHSDTNELCGMEWNYPILKKYLMSNCEEKDENKYDIDNDKLEQKIDEKEAKKLMKLELLLSRNYIENKYNLQKCPECQTLYFRGLKTVTTVKVKCVLCVTDFCWRCNIRWKEGHMCDAAFRDYTLNILNSCPTKTISGKSTPSIRACPKCTQLITHTQGCNHMACKSCNTSFCFVCLWIHNGKWCKNCKLAPRQGVEILPQMDVAQFRLF
eukprot:221439_1